MKSIQFSLYLQWDSANKTEQIKKMRGHNYFN